MRTRGFTGDLEVKAGKPKWKYLLLRSPQQVARPNTVTSPSFGCNCGTIMFLSTFHAFCFVLHFVCRIGMLVDGEMAAVVTALFPSLSCSQDHWICSHVQLLCITKVVAKTKNGRTCMSTPYTSLVGNQPESGFSGGNWPACFIYEGKMRH